MKSYIYPAVLLLLLQSAFAQQSVSKLEEAINSYVKQEKFTGTVLITNRGQMIVNKGYGFRDAAIGASNSPNTVYQLASIAKTFTSAVIMKLQEQGKLSVSDSLNKYFLDYPNGERITIAQLLSHTSGIFDYVRSPQFQKIDQSKPMALDSLISIFKDIPLDFEPGTKFSYSNSGYTLLGYIIEKVTGKPYRKVLEQLILKPLKLKNTGYDFIRLKNKNKAIGYITYEAENYLPATYVDPSILFTTGALYSTTGDLLKWHQALQGEKFLSTPSKMKMYTASKGPYGYGWFTDSLFHEKRVSHDGSVAGFKTNINRFPDNDLCVIVLSNSSSSRVGEMVRVLTSILHNQPYQLPTERKSIIVVPDTLKKYIGQYRFGPQTFITVTLENNRLFIEGGGLPKLGLNAESEVSFFAKSMDLTFEFANDRLYFYRGKQKLTGQRAITH